MKSIIKTCQCLQEKKKNVIFRLLDQLNKVAILIIFPVTYLSYFGGTVQPLMLPYFGFVIKHFEVGDKNTVGRVTVETTFLDLMK